MGGLIDFRMDVDETRLITRFDNLPKDLRRKLKATIESLTNRLLGMVEAKEPVRTGRLRRQTHAYVDENVVKNFVRGRVRILPVQQGINRTAAAFGALEYGAPGTSGRRKGDRVEVKGYRRRGGSVGAYDRKRPTIQAQRFLRSSAAVLLPQARTEIERVLSEIAAGR